MILIIVLISERDRWGGMGGKCNNRECLGGASRREAPL